MTHISNKLFFSACKVCQEPEDFMFLHYLRWFGIDRAKKEEPNISRPLLDFIESSI